MKEKLYNLFFALALIAPLTYIAVHVWVNEPEITGTTITERAAALAQIK